MGRECGSDEKKESKEKEEQRPDGEEGGKPKSTAEGRTEAAEKSECGEEKEKKRAGAIDKEEARSLLELPYYHGFLHRDDVNTVLRQDGDFLLRLSEVDADGGLQLVLSVIVCQLSAEKEERGCLGGSKEQIKLKHMVVSRQQGQYSLDAKITFPTVKEMIAHFLQHPHISRSGPIRLKKGIPLQKWEYGHSDVTMGKFLGAGAFGEVRQGLLKRQGGKKDVKVAVKLGKENEEKKENQKERLKEKIQEMMKEARIMKYLRHKNVVRLYGVMVLEYPIGIILELVGDSLDKYLKKYEGLVEATEKIQMCSGSAAGLSYIHSQSIIHRDIAARNCLYTADKVIKISDFGLSRVTDKNESEYKIRRQVKLPIKWLVPETIKDLVFSTKTDVYSYGVLCYEIFTNGAEPFADFGNMDTKLRVTSGQFLTIPDEAPPKLRDFIHNRIFVLDRATRVSMGDVYRFMENTVTESKMAEMQLETSAMSSTMKTHTESDGKSIQRSASREVVEEQPPSSACLKSAVPKSSSVTAVSKNLTAEPLSNDKSHRGKKKPPSHRKRKTHHLKATFGKK